MTNSLPASAFYQLEPHQVLKAIDDLGFLTTGEFLQLNSYENRVFEIGVENSTASPNAINDNKLIIKLYRPNRWSKEALKEEHDFLSELRSDGIPVVSPFELGGQSLFQLGQLYFSIFPKIRGRLPQEFLSGELQQVGRRLAQIHNVGARKESEHRPYIGTNDYGGWDQLDFLRPWISPEVESRYLDAAENILSHAEDGLRDKTYIRIHGDCHKGNLLNNGRGEFYFVDFDDFCNGPAAQDFWMLASEPQEFSELIKGYEELREFDDQELKLIPLLRGLRVIGYSAWIAKRWDDPSFPQIFPEFKNYTYWAKETEALEAISWQLADSVI